MLTAVLLSYFQMFLVFLWCCFCCWHYWNRDKRVNVFVVIYGAMAAGMAIAAVLIPILY